MPALVELPEWHSYLDAQVTYLEVHTAPRPLVVSAAEHMALERERVAKAPTRDEVDGPLTRLLGVLG